MARRSLSDELKERVPRFIVNTIILLILFFVYPVAPLLFVGITIPGLNMGADQLTRLVVILIIIIFLARTLPDALVLADIGTDLVLKHLGIREERPLRRASRDLVYMIIVILLAAAALPFLSAIPGFGAWLSAAASLVSLGLLLLLFYDMGRVLYRVLEEKAEAMADWLAQLASREDKGAKEGR